MYPDWHTRRRFALEAIDGWTALGISDSSDELVAIALGLLAALGYGLSDFVAGAGGRRGASSPSAIAAIGQPIGLVAALLAVLAWSPQSPTLASLGWGALAGIGSGVGSIALYHGLAGGRMSVVAPLSAVLAAALPAIIGWLLGERLPPLAWAGIAVALPAILLVSLQPGPLPAGQSHGILAGSVAGIGFALLFIALARAGTSAGSWPLVTGQLFASGVVVLAALLGPLQSTRSAWRPSVRPGLLSGVLGGLANLAYLAATGAGALAVVAVLTALYPAITVLLARMVFDERWSRLQAIGLLVATLAVFLISLG